MHSDRLLVELVQTLQSTRPIDKTALRWIQPQGPALSALEWAGRIQGSGVVTLTRPNWDICVTRLGRVVRVIWASVGETRDACSNRI